jgi:hypothetical protein
MLAPCICWLLARTTPFIYNNHQTFLLDANTMLGSDELVALTNKYFEVWNTRS